jgi:hypothetical protein
MTSPMPGSPYLPTSGSQFYGDGEYLYPFDQTNPLLWQTRNPDVDQSVMRLAGLMYQQQLHLRWYDAYLEGEQPISYMSAAMQRELGPTLRSVVLNWPRLVVDAYAARMKVEGFRYAGDDDTDDDLWAVWQANNLDKLFKQAKTEMLGLSRAYWVVGQADVEGGLPVITVESPFQMVALRDPRTRKVIEALKLWHDVNLQPWATLYQPNRTTTLRGEGAHWVPTNVDDHMLGVVPVVPMVNRGRILRPNGISEFHDVIPIVDAAIKAASDMMVSAEFHAIPRRWIFGVKKEDFIDPQTQQPLSTWSKLTGRVWSHSNPDTKAGQFPEAQLSNFHETIKLLAQLASQVAALPANYLAFNSVNPSSADAMRAIDAQLELRIRDKFTDNGEDLEDVMRLVLRMQTGEWDPKAASLETVWADPGTPTMAQKMDAAVKGVTARGSDGKSLIPVEQAREDLGYSVNARKRMAEMDNANSMSEVAKSLLDNYGVGSEPAPESPQMQMQLPAAPVVPGDIAN